MELLIKDPSLGERLRQALAGVLGAVLIIAVVYLLLELLRSTQAGDPFTRQNVRRINMVALIVGIGSTLVQFAQRVADNAMFMSDRVLSPGNVTFALHFTLEPLVLMMVILLIGETFRRGVVLRDDVEGLV